MLTPDLPDPVLACYELGIDFHPYQQDAIKGLLSRWQSGERRLHLVAPPGAGKTLIGLELLRRIGRRGVVLAPTGSIAHQWVSAGQRHFVALDSLEAELGSALVSSDPAAQTPLLALTYQRVSVKGSQGLHDNVKALFSQLAEQGYRTLILDECHHLLAHWADALEDFLTHLPDAVVIGLTATPPMDRASGELAKYLGLIGSVDHEILAPAVIREGHLAPFQDLVCLVRPTEAETLYISKAHAELQRQLDAAENTDGVETLSLWADSWLLAPKDRKGEDIPPVQLLEHMPDRAIACVRYLKTRGLFPGQAAWCPEMEDEPELADYAELLGAYGSDILQSQTPERWQSLKAVLSQLGYTWQRGRFVSRQGEIDKILALSAAKLRATALILKREQACLSEHLRALVLTDFEQTHAPGARAPADGLLSAEAGGALAVMRTLCADPELRDLQPVLVTGKTLLCALGLCETLSSEAESYFSAHGLNARIESIQPHPDEGFAQVLGSGPDWRSAIYLALVTDLLGRGLTRVLIGTRGLLGEGWDCRSLNTLIDLTAVSSFVSVNQIRGRTLRQDPDQPLKVANNWDVVALLPELSCGYRDFERFVGKHSHFYGLSDDGRLEQGVGHVHPLFEQLERSELLSRLEQINETMLQRAEQRADAHRAWKVGTGYRNRELDGLQLRLPDVLPEAARRQQTAIARLDQLPLQQTAHQLQLSRELNSHKLQLLAIEGLSLAGTVALFSTQPELWPFWLGGSQLFGGLWKLWLDKRLQQQPAPQASLLLALARCVLLSLQQEGLISAQLSPQALELSQRSGGFERLCLAGAMPTESRLFAQALKEMLEPLQEQRYVLAVKQSVSELQPRLLLPARLISQDAGTVYLPLPRHFARSRERADLFLKIFSEQIGPAELVYTRQGAGRQLLQSLQRQRSIWTRVQTVKIWE